MSLRNLLNKHKKFIILISIVIIAFFIYRYFWEKKNILVDINLNPAGNYETNIKDLITEENISKLISSNNTNSNNQTCDCNKICNCDQYCSRS